MKRTLGAFAVVCVCACGSVNKSKQPDAGSIVDAAPDAFDCSKFPLVGTFSYAHGVTPSSQATFKATDLGGKFAWTFASGTPATSTDASPKVSWSAIGQYDVTLAVTDSSAPCTSSSMQSVTVCNNAAPLTGPALTTATSGWINYGIELTPSVDTTLTGFTVTGKGLADTYDLTDVNNVVLESLTVPAGPATYNASVAWPLSAGQSYHLVNHTGDNLSYSGASFPVPGTSISVTGGWSGGAMQAYWFGFGNLVTCP